MTRRERVKTALAHRQPDKTPSCIHLAGSGITKHMDRLYERYVNNELQKKYRAGLLSYSHAVYYGMGNHMLTLSPPWWTWYDLPSSYLTDEEAPDFLPKTIGTGSYEEFARTLHNLREHTDAYILVTIWGSHFEKAHFARGIENFLADMAADPDYAQQLLDFIIHKNMVMLENIVHTPGIDGILLGSDWGSQRDLMISPTVWRQMIRGGEQKEYDLIHQAGLDVWIHSCGDIRRILPDLCEMGVDALNPIQPECMDVYRLKELYGDKISFWGGLSTQQTLPYGTPEQVREEALRLTSRLSRNGGYILAPAQEIQDDVPFENLCALIDAAQ